MNLHYRENLEISQEDVDELSGPSWYYYIGFYLGVPFKPGSWTSEFRPFGPVPTLNHFRFPKTCQSNDPFLGFASRRFIFQTNNSPSIEHYLRTEYSYHLIVYITSVIEY